MDIIEAEESTQESSNKKLMAKKKIMQKNEDTSIFPKEFITLGKLFSLKDQLSSI